MIGHSSVLRVLIIGAGMLAAVAAGYYAGLDGLSTKRLIVLAAGLVILVLVLWASETSYWWLFCLALFTTVVGHRTVHVGYWTYFVPFELIIWVLWLRMFTADVLAGRKPRLGLPLPLAFVIVWCVVRGALTWAFDGELDSILSWSSPLLLAVPMFSVTVRLVNEPARLKLVLRIFVLVSAVVSALGLVEHFVPSLAHLFSGFFNTQNIETQEGFARAAFGFWGHPTVASIIVWGILIALDMAREPERPLDRWLAIAVIAAGAVAVYISGQRSSWIALPVALLLYVAGRGAGVWLLSGALLLVARLLPSSFWARIDTLTRFVSTGATADTSLLSRLSRWLWSVNAIVEEPIVGVGYGHWLSHNVLLEIGSTVGLLPALVFVAFVLQMLRRLVRTALRGATPEARRYGWLFLALAATWLIQMTVETVFQTPELAAPQWAIMALVWALPTVFPAKPQSRVA